MRIILATDAPWIPTANSKQMAELAHRLQADLHTVYWMPTTSFSDGGTLEWEGVTILSGDDNYGNQIIKYHVRSTGAHLVITRGWAECFPQYGGSDFAWWAWHPGPISRGILRKSTRILGVSQDECGQLEKISGVMPFHVPRGIAEAYTNIEDREAVETFKRNHRIEDGDYVLSAIGPQDPHWKRMLDAFKLFHDNHENAVLYLHTDVERPLNLFQYCADIGLPDETIRLPHGLDLHMGYYDTAIAAMYHASDVHLVPGLAVQPIVESLACGTPVLTTDRPEAKEIMEVNGLGALVPPVTMHEGQPLLDAEAWAAELENAYKLTESERANHSACCQILAQQYHWRPVYEQHWKQWIATFEREERERITITPLSGAEIDSKRGTALLEDLGFVEEFGCEVARKTAIGGNSQEEDARNEIVKSWGPHPNIIPILRDGEDKFGRYYFDTPKLAPLRHIHNFSKQQGDKILDGLRVGLAFMHERGAAHCDVNPRNVLLTDTHVVGEEDCQLCECKHAKWEMGSDMSAVIFDFDYMQSGLDPETARLCDYEPLDERAIAYAVPVMQSGLATRGFHRVVTHIRNLDYGHSYASARPDMPYQLIDGVGERDCDERWARLHPDVKGKRVLDLGCNLGYFAARAIEEGAASVFAVDRDKAIVRAANELYPSLNGNCIQMDLDKALPEGEFDVCFCLSTWMHLRDGKRPMLDFLKRIPVVYWEDANLTKADLKYWGFDVERLARSERGRNLFKLTPKVV